MTKTNSFIRGNYRQQQHTVESFQANVKSKQENTASGALAQCLCFRDGVVIHTKGA